MCTSSTSGLRPATFQGPRCQRLPCRSHRPTWFIHISSRHPHSNSVPISGGNTEARRVRHLLKEPAMDPSPGCPVPTRTRDLCISHLRVQLEGTLQSAGYASSELAPCTDCFIALNLRFHVRKRESGTEERRLDRFKPSGHPRQPGTQRTLDALGVVLLL